MPDRIGAVCSAALWAWIGAASLFVAVGVREVTHAAFDSTIRDQLVLLRFPLFYGAGAGLLSLAWLAWTWRLVAASARTRRSVIGFASLTLALMLMAIDHTTIYSPLAAMIDPPGKPRTPRFEELHRASMRINSAGLMCALTAAVLARR